MTLLEKLQTNGIRRDGTPRSGFRYRHADGTPVKGDELERINALKLPPAWTDVRINPNPRAHLAAIGKDKAGRWQYRYHERFRVKQDAQKFERVLDFAEALPAMRAAVRRHIQAPGMGREKVMACILKILSTSFIRPGSQAYANENGSYGLATLRRKHVKVMGDTVAFSFPGKGGKQQERSIRDRQVARIVRELVKMPGIEVFKYVGDDGGVVDVRRRDINQYIKEVMGERFTAKDFRTWAGTLVAACALARAGVDEQDTRHARKKKVVMAVKEAAEILGNTPAICRASYIYPSVLSSFERGRAVEKYFETVEELVTHRGTGLHQSERALLDLLKESAKGNRPGPEAARRRLRKAEDRANARARSRERTRRKKAAAPRKPAGTHTRKTTAAAR